MKLKTYDLTVHAAARRLGVHPETLRRWCREGRVPAKKNTSGYYRFNADDVDRIQVGTVVEL